LIQSLLRTLNPRKRKIRIAMRSIEMYTARLWIAIRDRAEAATEPKDFAVLQ